MAASEALVDFVRDALSHGMSRAEVQNALMEAGWNAKQVKSALAAFADVDCPVPVPRPRASLSPREAFTYLLLFTTLYVVAFSLGRLLFQFINVAFPDPAVRYAEDYVRASIRFSVSSLIVAVPVFLYMSRLTAGAAKGIVSPVKRWLTYLTLFVSACVLIGDVTSLVNSLLGGELTVRFVLKTLTVGVIAGTAFWYYLSDLRRDEKDVTA